MGDFYTVVGRFTAAPTIPGTLCLITAGSTKRLRIWSVEIGSTNAAAVAGAEVSLGAPSTAGTGGASYTPLAEDSAAPASIFTALTATTVWSAEPTQPATWFFRGGIDVLATMLRQPAQPLIIPTSGRFAVRIETDNSATKVQWSCTVRVEEG